jgi:hypothetical protein
MMTVRRAALWLGGTLSLLAMTACSSVTIHGFNLTAGPASISIAQGGTSYLTVAAAASGSTPVTAAVVLYNLPPGITVAPASPTVTTGSQTVISLTASESTPIAANQVQVSAYAGLAYSDAVVSVAVIAAP